MAWWDAVEVQLGPTPETPPWDRFESRSRTDELEPGLAATVADPLWTLARQFQMGEFTAEDAGSPIRVEVTSHTDPITHVHLGKTRVPMTTTSPPLEVMVEREPVSIDLAEAADLGNALEAYLREALPSSADQAIAFLRSSFGIGALTSVERTTADLNRVALQSLLAGRAIDGRRVLSALATDTIADFVKKLSLTTQPERAACKTAVSAWRDEAQPQAPVPSAAAGSSAWKPDRLEYGFAVETEAGSVLSAPEYRNGELDWYAFDFEKVVDDQGADPLVEKTPTRVTYAGMPNPRWWTFEDSNVDFGSVEAGGADVMKMWVRDFALLYGDDWFEVPLTASAGGLVRIHKLEVFNVFGESQMIEPSQADSANPLSRWEMFRLFAPEGLKTEPVLLLQPPLLHRDELVLEEVRFTRDETANMAWAIEARFQDELGDPRTGEELLAERRKRVADAAQKARVAELAALALRASAAAAAVASTSVGLSTSAAVSAEASAAAARLAEIAAEITAANVRPPTEEKGAPAYKLATTVPATWVPYVPARVAGTVDQTALARGRFERPDGTETVARTILLKGSPLVREEAISRAGAILRLCAQRTRGLDGSTYVWRGRSSVVGRGEARSELRFDVLKGEQ